MDDKIIHKPDISVVELEAKYMNSCILSVVSCHVHVAPDEILNPKKKIFEQIQVSYAISCRVIIELNKIVPFCMQLGRFVDAVYKSQH